MTPEAIKELGTCRDHLVKHVIPDKTDLTKQAKAALDAGRYSDAAVLSNKLGTLEQIRTKLKDAFKGVEKVLYDSGLDQVDIPPLASPGKKKVEKVSQKPEKRPRRVSLPGLVKTKEKAPRPEDPFKPNYIPEAMTDVIVKDPQTNDFKFRTTDAIAKAMLKPEAQKDAVLVARAKKVFGVEKATLTGAIKKATQETGAQTIRELFEPLLETNEVKNASWETFY
ncbi:MAG: hypothetical protein ACOX50_02535 [Patescibacteria group bacterium]|jgi:hypothetical protein